MDRLPFRDRFIVGMLGFFIVMAFTIEWHWLRHGPALVEEARQGDWLARLWSVYGATDAMYFDRISSFSRTLESINVYFSQILNALLMYAIVKRKPWRHPLQMTLGAYLSYSVIVYFMEAHLSGYANMSNRTVSGFVLYYGVNLPWLMGHLYMLYDSFVAVSRRFAQPASM